MKSDLNMRRHRVAAVQMGSKVGDIAGNLRKAEALIVGAVTAGAVVVLLPELMAGGYRIAPDIWGMAEPVGGPITRWLCETARRHHIYLGTTILEADRDDFYNTFLLAAPVGRLAGTVRKSHPAWVEARYYRGHAGPHIIDTELGRIGVGICYENYLASHVRDLASASIDLLLQPTAAATPPPSWPVGKRGARAFDAMLVSLPRKHAQLLGVPVVMANMCGPLTSPLPGPLGQLNTVFPGLSSIVDGSGEVLANLSDAEGVITATVTWGLHVAGTIDGSLGRWAIPMPWYAPAWPIIQRIYARAYDRDTVRKRAASLRSRSEAG